MGTRGCPNPVKVQEGRKELPVPGGTTQTQRGNQAEAIVQIFGQERPPVSCRGHGRGWDRLCCPTSLGPQAALLVNCMTLSKILKLRRLVCKMGILRPSRLVLELNVIIK